MTGPPSSFVGDPAYAAGLCLGLLFTRTGCADCGACRWTVLDPLYLQCGNCGDILKVRTIVQHQADWAAS